MTYYETGLLSRDVDFLLRIAGCYAGLTRAPDPETWANMHMWQLASAPGFGDAYAKAIEEGNTSAARDPNVITDEQILEAVQETLTQEPL